MAFYKKLIRIQLCVTDYDMNLDTSWLTPPLPHLIAKGPRTGTSHKARSPWVQCWHH